LNLPKRSDIVQIRLADVRRRNQSLARGLVPTTGSRIMCVKGVNMDDEKEFYRSEIIRYARELKSFKIIRLVYGFIKTGYKQERAV
jgi:hypothetical protein